MTYIINRFDTSQLTTIEEGSLDQKFDLKFLGKNYASYGEILNENFLFLLENFAGDVPPPKPISGQVWYDSATKKLRYHTGEEAAGFKIWKSTSGVEYGIEPGLPAPGDMWFDTAARQLKVREETGWVVVGPQTAGDGTTNMISRVVKDITGLSHSIIAATVNDEVIYIISKDTFDLNTLEQDSIIPGWNSFPNNAIKKGLNLPNLGGLGVSTSDHRYWGTASDSDKLGGVPASDYLRSSVGLSRFSYKVGFDDLGLTVGNSDDLAVYIDPENGTTPIIENKTGPTLQIKVSVEGIARTPISITGVNIEPGATGTYNLGTSNKRWNTVFADGVNSTVVSATTINATTINASLITGATFSGVSESAAALRVNGVNRTGSMTEEGNSVAVRNASGNLIANQFVGLATSSAALRSGEFDLFPSQSNSANTIAVRDSSGAITAAGFLGLASAANTLQVSGTGRVGAVTASADTVVVRDAAANISVNVVNATNVSTSAITSTTASISTLNSPIINTTTINGVTFTGTAARADLFKVGSQYYAGNFNASTNTIAVRDGNGAISAVTFNGTAVRADTLSVSGIYRTASLASIANTIPVRDSNGVIVGNISGTAAGNLPITGGTLTGLLTLSSNPSSALHAATKLYVDSKADLVEGISKSYTDSKIAQIVNFDVFVNNTKSPRPIDFPQRSIRGFSAYGSTDFPGSFFGGITVAGPSNVQSGQIAFNWNSEESAPSGLYFRVNDDTGNTAEWSAWSQVATTSYVDNSLTVKAWARFSGYTGQLLASRNISSVVRTGSGRYTINITPGVLSNRYFAASGMASDVDHFISMNSYSLGSATSTTQLFITTVDSADNNDRPSDTVDVSIIIVGV